MTGDEDHRRYRLYARRGPRLLRPAQCAADAGRADEEDRGAHGGQPRRHVARGAAEELAAGRGAGPRAIAVPVLAKPAGQDPQFQIRFSCRKISQTPPGPITRSMPSSVPISARPTIRAAVAPPAARPSYATISRRRPRWPGC